MSQTLKFFVLAVFICVGCNIAHAQKKDFQKGYLIAKNGDTLNGFVKDRTPEPFVSMYKKIRFQKEGTNRVRKFGPDTILGYGYNGNDFISVPFREEARFFKFRYYSDTSAPKVFLRVVRRSANLVYFEQLLEQDDNNYLNTVPFFYKPFSQEMVRVTQGLFGFRKKHLAEYFSDCSELIQAVNRSNSEVESVMDLYEFYHLNCVD